MGSEPIPEWKPEEVRKWYDEQPGESRLAQAFATASNKFWWVEDDLYDFEKGTPEYEEVRRIIDAWGELMDKLKNEIFEILRNEGVSIPKTGQIEVLVPFMDRNGYYDGNGWWVRKNCK